MPEKIGYARARRFVPVLEQRNRPHDVSQGERIIHQPGLADRETILQIPNELDRFRRCSPHFFRGLDETFRRLLLGDLGVVRSPQFGIVCNQRARLPQLAEFALVHTGHPSLESPGPEVTVGVGAV